MAGRERVWELLPRLLPWQEVLTKGVYVGGAGFSVLSCFGNGIFTSPAASFSGLSWSGSCIFICSTTGAVVGARGVEWSLSIREVQNGRRRHATLTTYL